MVVKVGQHLLIAQNAHRDPSSVRRVEAHETLVDFNRKFGSVLSSEFSCLIARRYYTLPKPNSTKTTSVRAVMLHDREPKSKKAAIARGLGLN